MRAALELLPAPDLGLLERAGRFGPHDRALAWTREPQTVHVLVDDTIDSFRLDLPQTYHTVLTVRRVTVLTRP